MLNWAQIAKHSALVAAEQLWSRLHSSTLLDWNSYSKPWAVEARYWTHRPNPTLGMRYHEHPAEHTPMRPVGSHQTLISGSKVVKRGPNSYIYKYIYPNPTSKIFQIWRVPDISYDMLWLIYDSYHQEIPFGARLLSRQGAKSTFSWISWWWPSPKGQAPLSTGPLRWSRPPSSWRGQQMIHVWKRDETWVYVFFDVGNYMYCCKSH